MVALGITEVDICGIVRDKKDRPVDVNTLRKHFKREQLKVLHQSR